MRTRTPSRQGEESQSAALVGEEGPTATPVQTRHTRARPHALTSAFIGFRPKAPLADALLHEALAKGVPLTPNAILRSDTLVMAALGSTPVLVGTRMAGAQTRTSRITFPTTVAFMAP